MVELEAANPIAPIWRKEESDGYFLLLILPRIQTLEMVSDTRMGLHPSVFLNKTVSHRYAPLVSFKTANLP